jgi:hypothetical protein
MLIILIIIPRYYNSLCKLEGVFVSFRSTPIGVDRKDWWEPKLSSFRCDPIGSHRTSILYGKNDTKLSSFRSPPIGGDRNDASIKFKEVTDNVANQQNIYIFSKSTFNRICINSRIPIAKQNGS